MQTIMQTRSKRKKAVQNDGGKSKQRKAAKNDGNESNVVVVKEAEAPLSPGRREGETWNDRIEKQRWFAAVTRGDAAEVAPL